MFHLGLCKVMVGDFVFRIRSLGINLNHSCMNSVSCGCVILFACAIYLKMTTKVRVSQSRKVHQGGPVGDAGYVLYIMRRFCREEWGLFVYLNSLPMKSKLIFTFYKQRKILSEPTIEA